MRRKGKISWLTIIVKIHILCILGLMMITTIPLTYAQDTSEQIHEIDLYISGEALKHFSHTGNDDLSTKEPTSTLDESESFEVEYSHSSGETYYWYSYPLHMNITLNGDVHLEIWATCNQPREIAFLLGVGRYKPQDSGENLKGLSALTNVKMVHNEPINFSTVIDEERIERYHLKNYSIGESICMSVEPIYQSPQLPANVTILYNSTQHPSGMTIRTTSVSTDFSNSEVRDGKARMGVNITDAFGVYDITDYDINITDPFGHIFDDFKISEDIIQDKGRILLNITWDMAGRESGNYIVNVTVRDNNNNVWWKEETHYFNPLDGDYNPDDGKEEGDVQPFIPLIVTIILLIITGIGYEVKKMRKKKQPPG